MMPPFTLNNKKIVFHSKEDFSDNGRAFYEYLVDNKYNDIYEIIWLVKDPSLYKKYLIKNVKFIRTKNRITHIRTLASYRYIFTSKFIIYTHKINWAPKIRKNQVYIDLWHGCGYKAKETRFHETIFFDYCLVPGSIFIKTKSEYFDCPDNKIIPIGYPRYDWFKTGNSNAKEYCNGLLKGLNAQKIIIWMPTYRRSISPRLSEETLNNEFNIPVINSKADLIELDKFCREKKIITIIKQHYLQVDYNLNDLELSNIILLNNNKLDTLNVNLYELLATSDALISDYSSVSVDYMLLDKPIGYTIDDYEEYGNSRGWIFENPLEYMPGHHIKNMSELKRYINDVAANKDIFQNKRKKLFPVMHNATANYSKRIAEYFNISL